MDRRRLLEEGACLDFEGMPCTVENLVGKGSDAIVYLASYPDRQQTDLRHRVLVKELFPYHPGGGIYRDDKGQICVSGDGRHTMELHRISFERGNEVHIRVQGSHPGELDYNINTFSLNGTLYSVLGFSGGRSLDNELDLPWSGKTPLTVHIRRLEGVLDVLEVFHGSGYLHLDISPENILLLGDGKKERVSLIDYNSVHTLKEIKNGECLYYSAKEGYTSAEVRRGRISSIGYASDLYSLTAVLYRLITGSRLMPRQVVSETIPDISNAECLRGLPETVIRMVQQILARGLAVSVSRRYQNVTAMRRDLEELKDRVEGKGITHWALWETGRAGVLHMVKENPAYAYIREEEQVYPIACTWEDGNTVMLSGLYHYLSACEGGSVVLLGSGGTGKTTALLRMAYLQNSRYSENEPAVIYMPLYGYHNGGRDDIKNKILENLRFRQNTDSLETARHELLRLLSSPVHARLGERPRMLLLLDGWNEVLGEVEPLMEELAELAALPGVKVLLTSRSPVAAPGFREIVLRQLEDQEVLAILAKNGILPPENESLSQLLRIPMMLSIFIKTALDGQKQPFLAANARKPQEWLLAEYLSSMLKKEERGMPEESARRWQMEAAVYFVLPRIAELMKSRGTALSNQELLPLVAKCFYRLSKSELIAVFPQWIGHMADIRGGIDKAEEWYGVIVYGILFRRLGLLIREEDGDYRIAHQMIEEYLAGICSESERRFVRRRQKIRGVAAVVALTVLVGISWRCGYLPYKNHFQMQSEEMKEPYDREPAQNVLDTAFQAYIGLARPYETLIQILDSLQESKNDGTDGTDEAGGTARIDREELEYCFTQLWKNLDAASADHTERGKRYAENLVTTGDVMPWSEKPLDVEAFEEMIALPVERAADYRKYGEILESLIADEKLWEEFGESYAADFRQALESDACLAGKYYKKVMEPELERMEGSSLEEDVTAYKLYSSAMADYPRQNEMTELTDAYPVEQYQRNSTNAWREFRTNPVIHLVEEEEEENK